MAAKTYYWHSPRNPNIRTLLFQSEVPTKCKYRKKGNKPTPGYFDLAFMSPPADESNRIDEPLTPCIALEVGKNKVEMGDYDAGKDVEDPTPGDAAKIIRDLQFRDLKIGYILQFYDGWSGRNVEAIASKLTDYLEGQAIDCRIAIALLDKNSEQRARFYPPEWGTALSKKMKVDLCGSDRLYKEIL